MAEYYFNHKLNFDFFKAIDTHHFYLCLDNELLADIIRTLLEYLKINWTLMGRPTLTLVVNRAMFGKINSVLQHLPLQRDTVLFVST